MNLSDRVLVTCLHAFLFASSTYTAASSIGTGRSFRLHNLAANLPARVCRRMEIEIPFAIQQILCLFRCQGCLAFNGTCDGRTLDRELWLAIRSLRRRTVKMRCDSWTSQPAELNVIRELIGFSIQRTRHGAHPSAVFGGDFGRGLQVGLQLNRCSMRGGRHQGESAYGDDSSENTARNF